MLLGQGLFLVITMRMLGHTAVLPMPIHAAASKQDKRASCSKSNCKPRRCFTAAAACTCGSTPQSYTRLLKTSTSKAVASSASEFVFLTVGCCLCLATHVQVYPWNQQPQVWCSREIGPMSVVLLWQHGVSSYSLMWPYNGWIFLLPNSQQISGPISSRKFHFSGQRFRASLCGLVGKAALPLDRMVWRSCLWKNMF